MQPYRNVTMLREKMAAAASKSYNYNEDPDRVNVNQLLDLVVEDYRDENRQSTYDASKRIDAHLRPYFGQKKAVDVGTKLLKDYRRLRLKDAAEATVNKELAWLRRAFNLGLEHEPRLVRQVPRFPITSVDNARQGVMEHDVYRQVRDLLPPYARIALVIGYRTGARKGEIRGIRIEDIELVAGRIAVRKKATIQKGGMRYLPIYGDMAAELSMAISVAQAAKCKYIVQDQGKRVIDFEKAWKTACEMAGVPKALFHDLRRTALTNMIEAGYSEKEAMEISGHKTRAVFDRYHIVSSKRMKELEAGRWKRSRRCKTAVQDKMGRFNDLL